MSAWLEQSALVCSHQRVSFRVVGRIRLSTDHLRPRSTRRPSGHRRGMIPPFIHHSHAPLSSNIAIEERLAVMIGSANNRQLWALFLDASDLQLQPLISINRLPVVPQWPDLVEVVRRLDEVMQDIGAARLVLVWERFASPRLSDLDLVWVRQLAAACNYQEIRLRAMLVSHCAGIRWIAPDDFAF